MESARMLEQMVTGTQQSTDASSTDDHGRCLQAFHDFQRVLQTLTIHDYALFNNDDDAE